jgi:hypothetical protein
LEAETLVLRQQLNVLWRKSPKRLAFNNVDRLVFAGLYRVAPGVLDALKILKPMSHSVALALESVLWRAFATRVIRFKPAASRRRTFPK